MKFIVSRTSIWSDEESPCKEAKKETFDDNEIDWIIEINSLDELIQFSEKYGELIITGNYKGLKEIEIYDDYRE